MRRIKAGLEFLALSAGVAFAMPAVATQWLADSASSATHASCGSTSSTLCQMTIGTGTNQIKVRAYSTSIISGTSTATTSNNPWVGANLFEYTGNGFGISNVFTSTDTGEGSTPEHAVDNNQIQDILVIELPASGFDVENFMLGWAHEGSWSGTPNGHADVRAYFGGNSLGANYDFTNACFTGCTVGSNLTDGFLGFTEITSAMNTTNTATGNNIAVNTTTNFNGVQSGKYLVLTGALGAGDGGGNDFFKVKSISGSPGVLPAPGTLALLALGLFGLVTLRRRPALA